MSGGGAAHFLETTHHALNDVVDWQKETIAVATDGCSVMRGKHNGLVVRLEREIPHLVSIHCVAHDLQLAILDASSDLECMSKTFDPTLKSLFNFYLRSGGISVSSRFSWRKV